MAGRLFGTDGVRGVANVDLTAELTLSLAVAAAHVLTESSEYRSHGRPRPLAVVGRDPRVSGEFLESVLVGGLASAGVDVCVAGMLPTPGIAFLARDLDADIGVIISASHNPMPDNGIKFFARGGHKLPDSVEDAIEARMGEEWQRPTGADVGRITDGRPLRERYLEHLLAVCPNRLEGLTVVVDAAHGAASEVAPEAYRRMGAEVIAINAEPDGYNINDGVGSTHMDGLQRAVVEHGADLGIAHDGDADRCLAVAADGTIVDGDQIMAILALRMAAEGQLAANTLVATVMSNLGLKLAMEAHGVRVVTTDVGDRYVLAEMFANGYSLGGEQSGHIVPADHSTTGDGTLTALLVMSAMVNSGKPLAELASVVTVLPQVLVNVKGVDKNAVGSNAAVAAAVADAEAELHGTGRVLLRKSGTEPLVRVMVEAGTQEQADEVAHRLADVVRAELSLA